MLRDESKDAKESWNGKTRTFDKEPCIIVQLICILSIFSRTYLFQLLLTVMCFIVINSGCITLASMTVSLIRVSCTFGMRQQQREDHLKLHLIYIDVTHKKHRSKTSSDGCAKQKQDNCHLFA